MHSKLAIATTLAAGAAASITAAILVSDPRPSAAAPLGKLCSATAKRASPAAGYGNVQFRNSCKAVVQPALQASIAKMHSFEAEPQDFTAIASKDPTCVMAWWGAAMSLRGNPLDSAPDEKALAAGRGYVERAKAASPSDGRERLLVNAMDVYYRPYKDRGARGKVYVEAMKQANAAAPEDPDVASLYALALLENVDLDDTSFQLQKRAGAILEGVMRAHPKHPGAPHYLIHAYDYPALATSAVHAAEVYPTLATASVHAAHMPSHVWSMVGRWDQSISANRASNFLARPTSALDKGRGDVVYEHAFDFIAYARLQKGQFKRVQADLAALNTRPLVVQARYVLERGDWAAAANLSIPNSGAFDQALALFTRAYGAARAGDVNTAQRETARLDALQASMASKTSAYWAESIAIYSNTAHAWLLKAQGRTDDALTLMRQVAARDDRHGKHIALENKIVPMRESLADMENDAGQHEKAVDDYAASLRLSPNRLRSLQGATTAARWLGDAAGAKAWSTKFSELTKDADRSTNR